MRKYILLPLLIVTFSLSAQELNCEVRVVPKIQTADPSLFTDLQTAIVEFMNNRKWTNDTYDPVERIKCQFFITLLETPSLDRFRAEVSIVSSRPVYNSDYETVLLNHYDKEWEFTYVQSQPLEFSEGTHLTNLTSMLAFYAYIIIGLDYDSFARYGGTPWFLKAQTIANIAQNAPEPGWRSMGSQRNRFVLVENLLSPKFTNFRTAFYNYHLKALDEFYTNPNTGARAIVSILTELDKVNRDHPNSMLLQVFFDAKKQELIDIFAGAATADKINARNLLCQLDPGNCETYQKAIG
jgi:hypothetical protein